MASTDTDPSNSEDSPRLTINNGLHQAIFQGSGDDGARALLYDLTYGNTTPSLAAAEVIAVARGSKDKVSLFSGLSTQTIFLACEYPFLQPQLVSLVACIMQSSPTDTPTEMRSYFVSEMATTIGDAAQSNYGVLSEERHRTPDLISDHIHLNRFLARLLLALDNPEGPGDHITGLDDALFILSTSLEEHADSHDLPNVDIHAAAQYMIHAGELFFEACEKGIGQALADKSPLWATRGKLWTGKPGLSRERWDFWKSRFVAAESGEVFEETKKTARTAEQAMSHAEGLKESQFHQSC